MNGKSLAGDITLNAGDVGAFSKTNHMDKIPGQSYIGAFSCGHEGEWVKGISVGTGGDVGQIWIDSSAMLHTRFLNTNGNHKQQSYTARGECYTKSESDNRFVLLNKGTITSGYLLSKTANYLDDPSSRNLGRSGFLRTNNIDGLGDFSIHIAHPNAEGPQHARGISLNYGGASDKFGLSTYAFDENGKIQGQKKILTEDNMADMLYPVGIVLWFAQNKNPNTLFPKTQWKYIGENKTIRLANQNGSNVLSAGGSDSITLTGTQIPPHNHSFSATTSNFDYGTKTTNSNGNHFHDSGWGEAYTEDARYGIYDNSRGNAGSAKTDNDNYKYKTSTEGAHIHTVHIGAHTHTVSGTTGNTGSSSAVNITNSYIMLMGWYRIS
ncbi:phage baseplate protein [Xenorhabdus stockiae]|uniref:phage baseplate protein n=1 Tax=Xenorhabdus stockiae TaxID=351614 RepID=UPI003CF5DAB7